MRGTCCLRGLAIIGVAFGATMAPGGPTSDLLGIGSAKAEKFYTRKRVNGQWITGMFPAEDTVPTRRIVRAKPVAHVKPAVVAALGVAAASVATKVEPPAGQSTEGVPHHDATLAPPAAAIRTEWASVPPQPAAVTAPHQATASLEMRSSPGEAAPSAVVPATDERLSRLRSALLARAMDLAAKAPDSPATVSPAPDPARTDSLAAADAVKNAVKLEPRSVSYDFESGVKTTVFATSVVREPFDVASIKRIALPSR